MAARRATLVVGVVILLAARLGIAHALDHPKRDELRLGAAQLELIIDQEIAPGEPARSLRQLFDRNRDGRLNPEEQAALLEHLAQTAALHVALWVDDIPVALSRSAAPARGERLGDPASSTGLLAVRVVLHGSWPPGSGDWRGRRRVRLSDDAPDATGHVPAQVFCSGCELPDANLGTYAHDEKGDWILGAEISPAKPLELKVRLP